MFQVVLIFDLYIMADGLPMPAKIPYPDLDTLFIMEKVGFKFISIDGYYVSFHMPVGWRFLNVSEDKTSPKWHFVDRQNIVRFVVSGSWGGDRGYNLDIAANHINSFRWSTPFQQYTLRKVC